MSTMMSPWGISGGDHEYITGGSTHPISGTTVYTATSNCWIKLWTYASSTMPLNVNADATSSAYLYIIREVGMTETKSASIALSRIIDFAAGQSGNLIAPGYLILSLNAGDYLSATANGANAPVLYYQVYTA